MEGRGMMWYILVRYNYGPDGRLWDKPGPVMISDDKSRIEPLQEREKREPDRKWSEWKMVEVEAPKL